MNFLPLIKLFLLLRNGPSDFALAEVSNWTGLRALRAPRTELDDASARRSVTKAQGSTFCLEPNPDTGHPQGSLICGEAEVMPEIRLKQKQGQLWNFLDAQSLVLR